jgi:cell division protein FtsL
MNCSDEDECASEAEMSIDYLEEVLLQKIALLESNIKHMHKVIKAYEAKSELTELADSVEATRANSRRVHQLDVVFLTAYERILKTAGVDAPEQLPEISKQMFKQTQKYILHIQDLTAILKPMETDFDVAAESVQNAVSKHRKFDRAEHAYKRK